MSDYRALTIGEKAPHFKAETTFGPVNFPEDYRGRWVVFFSHPGDLSPVAVYTNRKTNNHIVHLVIMLPFLLMLTLSMKRRAKWARSSISRPEKALSTLREASCRYSASMARAVS